MTKVNKITLLLLSFACRSATCSPSQPPLLEELEEPSLTITGPHVNVGVGYYQSDGSILPGVYGSGIVISHKRNTTFILTAKHATTLCDSVERTDCGLTIRASEKALSQKAEIERNSGYGLDATIISTSRIANPVAKISGTNAREREAVFVLGSPGDVYRTFYRRRILSYGGQRNSRIRYLMTELDLNGSILVGFSGGGVYNMRSQLVAMTWGRRREKNSRGVCIPIESLHELIRPFL